MQSLLRSSSSDSRSSPAALFARYKRDEDDNAREALVLQFLPLARTLARRYLPSSIPYDDLVQVASLALIKAVDRFDPERGSAFEAFAVPTILGELKRHFRDSSWSVHVARESQERALAIANASERLASSSGRTPSVRELALYLELSEEEVLDGLQARQAYVTNSLDAPAGQDRDEDDSRLMRALGVEETGYELVDTRMAVSDAARTLPVQERRILRMRFIDEMTQTEIGSRLGVSQMQVSRILRRTLGRLRELLDGAQTY